MLRRVVCPGLCAYFKPGKVEEVGCGGLIRLAADGVTPQALLDAPLSVGVGNPLSGLAADDPRLMEVCAGCDFLVGGCDFRDPAVDRDACSPCGGLKAVAFLLARRDLTSGAAYD